MVNFDDIAQVVEEQFGVIYDEEEGFFVCPFCDEPIYDIDYGYDDVLLSGYCPICGAALIDYCDKDNYYDDEDEDEDEFFDE